MGKTTFLKGAVMNRRFVPTALCALLCAVSCGGAEKISLNNGTGHAIEEVTLTIGGESQSWSDIEPDESFSSRLELPPGEVQCNLSWVADGVEESFDFQSISRAPEAKVVSIFFSKDELSVGYEF
jgi:hypothetical protein